MSFSVEEKRKYYRFPVSTPIQYHDTHKKELARGYTCDVSEGGASFLANRSISKGETLQVSIPVAGQVFQRSAKVAYSNHVVSMGLYRTGIEFQDSVVDYDRKLAEQHKTIRQFQRKRSAELKRPVSEAEAARMWVERYMQQFSSLF